MKLIARLFKGNPPIAKSAVVNTQTLRTPLESVEFALTQIRTYRQSWPSIITNSLRFDGNNFARQYLSDCIRLDFAITSPLLGIVSSYHREELVNTQDRQREALKLYFDGAIGVTETVKRCTIIVEDMIAIAEIYQRDLAREVINQ